MRRILLLLTLLPFASIGQISETFSDGDFYQDPQWTGDLVDFEVNPLFQLHLKATGADSSALFTKNRKFHDAEWSWWIKLSFNTSANNYARIYFTADSSDLRHLTRGYYFQAGGADDSLRVIRQTGNSHEKMMAVKAWQTNHSTNTMRIKIVQDPSHRWEVWLDTTGGSLFFKAGAFFDSSMNSTHWFGFFCKYTASNATKFYFDDIYAGPVRRDTVSPRILAQELTEEGTLEVTFSEAIDPVSAANPQKYISLVSGAMPDSAVCSRGRPDVIVLYFDAKLLESNCDTIRIRELADLSGNVIKDTIIAYCHYHSRTYDVIINEIHADPEPAVELPDGEFVELFNKTKYPVNLKNWTFAIGTSRKVIPAVTLPPGGYLILARDSAFRHFGPCCLIFTGSSSLSNEGTVLVLRDQEQRIIHAVHYDPEWYRDSFKAEGGWSLEMMDPRNPCGCETNWAPSSHPYGGTPGGINSVLKVNPDGLKPEVQHAVITDSNRVAIYFSESMDSISLLGKESYILEPGMLYPDSVFLLPPLYQSAHLRFPATFDTGIVYTLRTGQVPTDCSGNPSGSEVPIRFAIPDTASLRDLVINEILSDPETGGARYIEIYNRSEKVIDLRTLVIAGNDTSNRSLPEAEPVSAAGFLVFPGDYRVLTSDKRDILARYWCPDPDCFTEPPRFPTFGNDSGTIVLARKDNFEVIDRVTYQSGMHYPLLVTREGVALERLCPDWSSDASMNWHSAAETAGFGTPGYANSQALLTENPSAMLEISPEIFSPDNDGHEDLLSVSLRDVRPGFAVTVTLFDATGRLVRSLANNVLSENSAVFIWDGITKEGRKAALGYYVILAELVHPDGTTQRVKKTVVVGGTL